MGRMWCGGSAQLTFWSAGSPAKTSLLPARGPASRGLARGCGSRCCGSCEKCDPLGYSLRTFLLSALAEQTPYSLDWKRRATPAGRSWWVLGRSGRRTGESESGSWLTPKASDGRAKGVGGSDRSKALTLQVQDWPTPTASEAGHSGRVTVNHSGQTGLAEAVNQSWATPTRRDAEGPWPNHTKGGRDLATDVLRDWRTPRANDWKGGVTGAQGSKRKPSDFFLPDQINATVGPQDTAANSTPGNRRASSRGRLNPDWVSCLMGYPANWLVFPVEW